VRELEVSRVADALAGMCGAAATAIPPDVALAVARALEAERSPIGREVLGLVLSNHAEASARAMPLCQDTGTAVVFMDVGQEVLFTGGSLAEAVDEGVRRGYASANLRASMLADPLDRGSNTRDNTPAVLHARIVPGDAVRIALMAKGGGAENMSAMAMLNPSCGRRGVRDFVVSTVERAGGSACPPVIVGVGIGGNFEGCALLAKRSLLRPAGAPSGDPSLAALEQEMLEGINGLGTGPQGLGGSVTALAVHVLSAPCHMSSLPVAVNLQCHASRHLETVL